MYKNGLLYTVCRRTFKVYSFSETVFDGAHVEHVLNFRIVTKSELHLIFKLCSYNTSVYSHY